MKTPKRDCDWCNSWELEHCGRSWCGDCERGKRMFAQSARWIRKNREARLRHRIKKEIWKHERDEAKHNEFLRFINDSARLLHDLAPMSGTCGHDIEGS